MRAVHESEVIRFSTEVETLLPFTTDAAALGAALAYDPDFDRQTTALLAGLGPAATDGRENISMIYEQDAVLAQLIEVRIAELDPPPEAVHVELDGMALMLTAPVP